MFHFIEKKINITIHTFFAIGLLCFALGIAVLMSAFLLQLMVGLLFFFMSYFALHIAYHMQAVRDSFKIFVPVAEKETGTKRKKKI